MPTVKHTKVSLKADGTDNTLVRPSDWNANHDVEALAGGVVFGRDTSGPGAMQELPIAVTPAGDVSFPSSKGATGVATGTTAQRPSGPVAGTIRYNTDLSVLEVYIGGNWVTVAIGNGVPVGSVIGWYQNTPPPGWIFMYGQTIGNAASGAAFAGDFLVNLFAYFWNSGAFPVYPSRGGTANGDWALNKTIQIPNECGRVAVAPDSGFGVFPGYGIGAAVGEQTHSLTLGEMPGHAHALTQNFNAPFNNHGGQSGGGAVMWDSGNGVGVEVTGGDGVNWGSVAPHNNIQPSIMRWSCVKW